MTDAVLRGAPEGPAAIRELLRRCGHELRNAQNAAAVNLEVVRSRIAAGKSDAASLQTFIDNATQGMEDSARFTEAFVALSGALATSPILERGTEGSRASGFVIELPLPEEAGRSLAARVAPLADSGGFSVEAGASGVILRIPPENETDRA